MFIGDDTDDLLYNSNEAPILHQAFPAVRPPSLERRTAFLSQNDVKIIDGQFTDEEDNRIINNYFNFLALYKVDDSTATRCGLLGFASEDPDHEEIIGLVKQLVKPCGFYFRLAEKMPNRLICAVMSRAKKLLSPFRKQKEIDRKTKQEIIEYAKSLGNIRHLYAHIANKFDCDPAAARRIVVRSANIEKDSDFNCGKWSRRENVRLLDAICKHLDIEPFDITRQNIQTAKISWPEVAKDVRTRSFENCRVHAIESLVRGLPLVAYRVIKRRVKQQKRCKDT